MLTNPHRIWLAYKLHDHKPPQQWLPLSSQPISLPGSSSLSFTPIEVASSPPSCLHPWLLWSNLLLIHQGGFNGSSCPSCHSTHETSAPSQVPSGTHKVHPCLVPMPDPDLFCHGISLRPTLWRFSIQHNTLHHTSIPLHIDMHHCKLAECLFFLQNLSQKSVPLGRLS